MDDYIELERRVLATVRQFFDQIADTPDDDCTLNPAVVGPVLRDFLLSPETLSYETVLGVLGVIPQRRVSSFNLKAMAKLFLGTQRRALLRQDFFSSGDTYGGRRPDGTNGTDVRERINSFKLVLTSEITLGDINSTVGDLFSRLEIPVNVNLEHPWPRPILRNMNIQQWNDQNEARRSSFVRDSECNRIATVLEQAYGGTVDIVDQLRTTRHSGVINSIVDIAICRDGDPKVLIEIKRGSIFPLWQELQGSSIVSRAVPREHQGSSLLSTLRPLTSLSENQDNEVSQLKSTQLIVRQLISYLSFFAKRRIILTDGRCYLLLELDYSNYKGPVVEAIGAEEFSVIPMKFRFIDSWSSSQYLTPAALMVFSYVADMIADDDASNVQKFVNLVLREIPVTPSSASSRTRPSTSTTDPSLLSAVSGSGNEMDLFSTFMVDDMNKPSDKFLTLQKGTEYSGHMNNVYQFETKQFESMFKCQISEDSKEVVLKVLDREQAKSLFRAEMADSPFEVDHEDSDKYYRTLRDKYHFPEIEVLHIIMHHNQMNKGEAARIINSPRLLLHGEIDLIKGLSSSKYIWSHEAQGNFMLISSIEDDIENLNSDTFKDGVRQLKLLSEIGVYHRDIKRGNLRFSAVGKLSFIDFSHVWLLKKDESPECCFNLMRAKLYQVLKDLGVEGLDL